MLSNQLPLTGKVALWVMLVLGFKKDERIKCKKKKGDLSCFQTLQHCYRCTVQISGLLFKTRKRQ